MKTWWSKISLLFFFAVALIGTSLRATSFVHLPLQYSHLVHAHSHTAFQGWIYTLMLLLITRLFLSENQIQKGRYSLQFKLTIGVIIGVLISFSFQGYGLYSIALSSVFELLNYWFIFRFLRDVKQTAHLAKNTISLRFVKTGLWLGLLSTLAPWGIGIISAKGLNGSEIYQSFIYAFLHFQYNGWFLFVVIGLFFKFLERDGVVHDQKLSLRFYWCFTIAVVPALSLSLLGMSFGSSLVLLAYFSAACQLVGAVFFFLALRATFVKWIRTKHLWSQLYFTAFLSFFFTKVILQALSAFAIFEQYAFGNKSIILAYLHLSLIGVISFLLLAVLIELKWLVINWFTSIGSTLLLVGFIMTELILAMNGLLLTAETTGLFVGSASMAVGIFLLIISPQKSIGALRRLEFQK